jgi:uncharacterized protein (TIGR03435 family)
MRRVRIDFFRSFCVLSGVAIILLGAGVSVGEQTAATELSFDVATIKPVKVDAAHPFDPKHFWAHVYEARASYWSMTLESLITYAYDVQPFQVSGSGWTNTDRFDIEARFPKGAGKGDEKKMLQALLKERFKLAFHIEERKLSGYALVVGKHGSKLSPSLPDPAKPESDAPSNSGDSNVGEVHAKSAITRNAEGSSTLDRSGGGIQTVRFDREAWSMHYQVGKMTMEELAGRLGNCLGSGMHKVEDQTGIEGYYQVAYDCPLGRTRPAAGKDATDQLPSDPQGGSSLTRSLDALGLKLEKRVMPQEVYVIEHAEKPSEN